MFLSIQYVAMIIIGGMGSLLGAILGAIFVTLFPYAIEGALRAQPGAQRYAGSLFAVNYAAFGAVMILFLVLEPLGLVGIWRRVQTYFLMWPWRRQDQLLRAISGFHGIDDARVTEGSIRFKGVRIDNGEPHRIARCGIALVPERDKAFPNLTVAENLTVPTGPRESAAERHRREEQVGHFFPKLRELRHRLAGLLSGGERQMLAIASALVCKPELLLVDELSLGLAPLVVDDLMARLVEIKRELGITVMLVEQSAAVALEVGDYSYVLENGRIVLGGDAARLKGNADIQEFYLGHAREGQRRSYRDVKQYRRTRRWYG